MKRLLAFFGIHWHEFLLIYVDKETQVGEYVCVGCGKHFLFEGKPVGYKIRK